jgi:hypothetical protein
MNGSWIATGLLGTAPVERVVYGERPRGFITDVGPHPLAPGCYTIVISGSGRTSFTIDTEGTVRDLGKDPK